MTYENYQDLAVSATERDPRKSAFGYFSGGSFVLDSVRMFSWFESLEDLVEHAREIEPRIHDIEEGDDLERFQSSLDPILNLVRAEGPNEATRSSLNAAAKEAYVIEWWGTFESLVSGPSDFAKGVRADFRDGENDNPILSDELDEFVDFLQNHGF